MRTPKTHSTSLDSIRFEHFTDKVRISIDSVLSLKNALKIDEDTIKTWGYTQDVQIKIISLFYDKSDFGLCWAKLDEASKHSGADIKTLYVSFLACKDLQRSH